MTNWWASRLTTLLWPSYRNGSTNSWKILGNDKWVMVPNGVGYFKWWVMSDKWWLMSDEWWVMKKINPNKALVLKSCGFFFFFWLYVVNVWIQLCLAFFSRSRVLFTRLVSTFFNKNNLKIRSYGTIHKFKNYFVTNFFFLVFSFQQ